MSIADHPYRYDIKNYEFHLPSRLIAQYPAVPRDSSRLLYLSCQTGSLREHMFTDIIQYLEPGDALVLNESRVIAARLQAMKRTGARVEIFLLKRRGLFWEALVKPAKRVKKGMILQFPAERGIEAVVQDELEIPGGRLIQFLGCDDNEGFIHRHGATPLPPYIGRTAQEEDRETYQTVYARQDGSVAAPTAGLHFTTQLLQTIAGKGVRIARIVLHVGLGTFRPVQVHDIRQHQMHHEDYEIDLQTARILNETRREGKKIIAVGTTVARTLETVYNENHGFTAASASTDKFIFPGYRFRAIDGMVTNFHLPGSTLIMLVSAFAGRERILSAYHYAISREYRFFSYGDAMLIC